MLVVRVHPELLANQQYDPAKCGKSFWKCRYQDINAFEHHLTRNRTVILKFFLNISKAEQKKRFLERIDNPDKHWKFSNADISERGHWNDYMRAFEKAYQRHQHRVGPLVCDSGQPQVGRPHIGFRYSGLDDRLVGPQVSRSERRAARADRRRKKKSAARR